LPALINAVLDALAPLGVKSLDMPATSERIWQAMRDARARPLPRRPATHARAASG
jgi:aerobic carbon-monoxide dehydrogenase large subunit